MEQNSNQAQQPHEPWNKGKLVGQKTPFKLREIWAIRVWLQTEHRTRELALFDLGLDSKLRACDLVKLRVRDICHGDRVATHFEELPVTLLSALAWLPTAASEKADREFLGPDTHAFLSTILILNFAFSVASQPHSPSMRIGSWTRLWRAHGPVTTLRQPSTGSCLAPWPH